MQPPACRPKAERARSHDSGCDQHEIHRQQNSSATRGCTPCSPARACQSGLFFRRRHRAERQAPDHSQATSQTVDCPAYHCARLTVSKRIQRQTPRKLSRDSGRRQDQLERSTRHHAVLRCTSTAELDGGGIMVDGRGRYIWVSCG